ncbi:hypothetical protein C7I84_13640 [Mesorhizobium ephedrae]|uniref:Uncharacterized protein n=2 Tax=Kumtagia ephedrae TaxID=2116701 RepID=A0A2P7S9C4_9HYPH|nr:hypothetical protein C7I84_13640 [Mesorhizobium ephedrae]
MMPAAVIVPGDGPDQKNFERVGEDLVKNVYGGNGIVYKCVFANQSRDFHYIDMLPVSAAPNGGSGSFLEFLFVATCVLTVSHVGELDGPIMSYLTPIDKASRETENADWRYRQPWHTNGTGRQLCPYGDLFWKFIGRAPRTTKIILLGCESGNRYAQCVANSATIPVWGFDHSCAAADIATMRPIVSGIEGGKSQNGISVSWPS